MLKILLAALFILLPICSAFAQNSPYNITIQSCTNWNNFKFWYDDVRYNQCPQGQYPTNIYVGNDFVAIGTLQCINISPAPSEPFYGGFAGWVQGYQCDENTPDEVPYTPIPNLAPIQEFTPLRPDAENFFWQDYPTESAYSLTVAAITGVQDTVMTVDENTGVVQGSQKIGQALQKIVEADLEQRAFDRYEERNNRAAQNQIRADINYTQAMVSNRAQQTASSLDVLLEAQDSISSGTASINSLLEEIYPEWSRTGDGLAVDVHEQLLSEFDYLADIIEDSGTSGPVTLNSTGYLSDGATLRRIDQKTDFMEMNIGNTVLNAQSTLLSNIDWARQNVIYNTDLQKDEILDAIASSSGSGGGITEEFASGLIGDYTGDDYSDSEAEGILGTSGLGVGDLDGQSINLDSIGGDYFSFAPAQCFEPIQLNFSVFGTEHLVEIDLNPLCSVFNILGILFFIASNILAVRIVVGAF